MKPVPSQYAQMLRCFAWKWLFSYTAKVPMTPMEPPTNPAEASVMRRPHSVAVMMSFGLHRRRVMIRRPWGHWSGVVDWRRVIVMRAVRIVVALRYNASATSARLCLQCLWER